MAGKTNDRFRSLSPCFIEEETVYDEALDSALKNDDIKNIAITGIYGSGKSSVWRSYQKKRKLKDVITVSLGNYTNLEANVDPSKEKISSVVENRIEKQIINQILAQVPADKIPLCKYEMKENKDEDSVNSIVSLILIFIISVLFWFVIGIGHVKMLAIPEKLLSREGIIQFILLLIPILGVVLPLKKYFKYMYTKNKFKLAKINFKGAEAIIDNCDYQDETILDKDIREIVYIIKASGSKVVVFEDLDRFNDTTIFVKLRELNFLINANLQGDYAVNFIYMVKDSLFATKERTKFFDYSIPIVPAADSNNSEAVLINRLNEVISNEDYLPDEWVLANIALYINDMRLITNIINEYIIYSEIVPLKGLDLDKNKLFTMVVLKNLMPKEFDDLQNDRGGIHEILTSTEVFRERVIENKKLRGVENIESEQDEKLDIMQMLTISEVLKSLSDNDINLIFHEILNENKLNQNNISFIRTAIIEGLLDETYPYYKGVFYNGNIQANDTIFLKNIKARKKQNVLLEIENPKKVYEKLNRKKDQEYFRNQYCLNKNMFIYCLTEFKHSALENMCLAVRKYNNIEQLITIIQNIGNSEVELFVVFLLKNNMELLDDLLQSTEGNDTIGIFEHLISIIYCHEESGGKNITKFNPYLEEKQNIIFTIPKSDKEVLFSNMNNVNFKSRNISVVQKNEYIDEIFNRKVYELPVENIEHIINKKISEDEYKEIDGENISRFNSYLEENENIISKIPESDKKLLFSNMDEANVKLKDISKVKNNEYVDEIIKRTAYELSVKNVRYIVAQKTGKDEYGKLLTIICESNELNSVKEYIYNNFSLFINKYIDKKPGEVKFSNKQDQVLEILNYDVEKISLEIKQQYLANNITVIEDISEITDKELWLEVVERCQISTTIENIRDYYTYQDKLTDDLIDFINQSNASIKYQKLDIDDTLDGKLIDSMVACNELTNEKYSDFTSLVKVRYLQFEFSDIESEKMMLLIKNNIIEMNSDNLNRIIEDYNDNLSDYILSNLTQYKDLVSKGYSDISADEVDFILHSNMTQDEKIDLIKHYSNTISIGDNQISDTEDELITYILENNFSETDFSYLAKMYNLLNDKSKKIVGETARVTPFWDEVKKLMKENKVSPELEDYLLEIEEEQYKIQLAEIILQRSKTKEQVLDLLRKLKLPEEKQFEEVISGENNVIITNETTNHDILTALQEKGWIDSYGENKQGEFEVLKK